MGICGQVPIAMEVAVAAQSCLRSSGRSTYYGTSVLLGRGFVPVCVISDLSYVVYYVYVIVYSLTVLG